MKTLHASGPVAALVGSCFVLLASAALGQAAQDSPSSDVVESFDTEESFDAADWFAMSDVRVWPEGFFFGRDAGVPRGSLFDPDESTFAPFGVATFASSLNAASAMGSSSQAIVTPTSGPPMIGSCQIYPSDNAWNTDVSTYPVNPLSTAYMTTIAQDFTRVQTAFGNPVGSTVTRFQPKVTIECTPGVKYCTKSDMYTNGSPTPMPIPPDAEIENLDRPASDRHIWVIDTDACALYELFHANRINDRDGSVIPTNDISQLVGVSWHWRADSAAVYNLTTNALRPLRIPASTGSGLPIFPGLVKYEEVLAGAVNHALIFAVPRTQLAFIAPATTYATRIADPLNPTYPPMGLRLRLKASYDISGFYGQARVIAAAMKRYGLFVADNGASSIRPAGSTGLLSQWSYWPDLNQQLATIPVSAFEVVQTGPVQY